MTASTSSLRWFGPDITAGFMELVHGCKWGLHSTRKWGESGNGDISHIYQPFYGDMMGI